MQLKFTPLESDGDRGLVSQLKRDDGRSAGLISSSFVSCRTAPFTSNRRPGWLTIRASAFNVFTSQVETIAEYQGNGEVDGRGCYTRREADAYVRKWIAANDIRARVIEAAKRLNAAGVSQPKPAPDGDAPASPAGP